MGGGAKKAMRIARLGREAEMPFAITLPDDDDDEADITRVWTSEKGARRRHDSVTRSF